MLENRSKIYEKYGSFDTKYQKSLAYHVEHFLECVYFDYQN
jgi:hypothetical protein